MPKKSKRPAVLALADGTHFKAWHLGAEKSSSDPAVGEVVFNTSMYGYQEILTDPSYAGQIITFTYPHIGNVGCNEEDNESSKVHVEGVILRDLSPVVSNFRATKSLSQYLEDAGKMGIYGLDTRAIVAHLRDNGSQMGAMACGPDVNVDELVEAARKAGSMEGKDYVKAVTCAEAYSWNELPWSLEYEALKGSLKRDRRLLSENDLAARPHVVAIDCGIKNNILRLLLEAGFRVTVVPATHSSEQILNLRPDALFISNGPGDPATLGYVVNSVKGLVGKFPVFGICLGHQILAQVFGGKTYKLKFGHRGGNHPVKDLTTGKVEITVQNHGFAVDAGSLGSDVRVSHLNLNDNTVEGLDLPEYRIFCIQYHPEASPGPHDSLYLFKRFFASVVA
ncbi:MAG: glutamine-hydrolyzing carbamoyl-phosphate synthase small subunit [Deltaproteobacteria bacterium]|nr:glutamine-hydrolyzing carbamoyl-phosphate synthase small subunit [Deltaproteobacteria bacterium]